MPTDATFRFSTYLSFALACAALGYAESDLLPEVVVFAVLAVVGLVVLYFLESRVTFLSIPAANRLGMAIGLIYMMWSAWRVKREIDTHEFINMGWPMLLVALCGPLVMVAVVAKVARSDKHAGDYWTLHGVSLAGIGLSAALAEEAVCFVFIGLYLVVTVWSLTLLHLGRASGSVPPIPGGRQPVTKTIAVSADPTGHRTDLRPALLWSIVALAIAVPLYLLTPRSDAAKADFGKPRIEIGYNADQMVDLNRTGPLKTNSEVAFEFKATYPDNSPKIDCNLEQRWHGRVLRHYSNGEWKTTDDTLPQITYAAPGWKVGDEQQLARRVESWSPPNLGPGQFTFEFDIPPRLPGLIWADPVQWVPNEPPPIATITRRGMRGWLPIRDGSFYWDMTTSMRSAPRKQVQVYCPREDHDMSPPFHFVDSGFEEELAPLRQNPVPRIREYADRVLKTIVDAGELPNDFRDELTLQPKPQYHDLIARKFSSHLATTSTLQYTTDLRRENKAVDPVEDFLFYSKSGHCERFATALVLMLRAEGIPAAFVLGFKGCEHVEDGKYIVRQEHAHAWVMALVLKPGEPVGQGDPRNRVYQWRSLDPTPGSEHSANSGPWWRQANQWMETRFEMYVTNYTAEERRKALAALVTHLTRPDTLATIVGGVLFLAAMRLAIRRLLTRVKRTQPGTSSIQWFNELVSVLTAHGIIPAPSDTPLEFATTANAALRERGHAEVADVPLMWANAYYQDRFGGMPPSDARLAELDAALERLRQALSK